MQKAIDLSSVAGRVVDLQAARIPPELHAVREALKVKELIDKREAEARELVDALEGKAASPELARAVGDLRVYHARLRFAQATLAPIHARALARIASRVADDCDEAIVRLAKLVDSGDRDAAGPASTTKEGK